MKTGRRPALIRRLGAAMVVVAAAAASAHADDHPNSCEQATRWPVAFGGSPLTGVIETPGDVDALALELAPGQLYRFNIWSGEGSNWARVRLLAPGCGPERAVWMPLEPIGTDYWFLAPEAEPRTGEPPRLVALIDSPYGAAGEFLIPIERVGGPYVDDLPSSRAEAKRIVPDATDIRGELEFGNDRDVFVFAARVRGMYRVEIVEGRDRNSRLNVRLDAGAAAGLAAVTAAAPAMGCDFKPEGCSAARIVAPEPASGGAAQVYITVQNGDGHDDSLPAQPYVIRVIDEGDFVPVQGAPSCEDPSMPAIRFGAALAIDPPMSTWLSQTLAAPVQAGHVYRLATTAVIGEPRIWLGVTESDCMTSLAYMQPDKQAAAYFRSTADGVVKLTMGRYEIPRDPLDRPLPGSVVVRLDDLGPIGDDHPDSLPDHLDPTMVTGGRIEHGVLEYADDRDVLIAELAPGVRYRIEARLSAGDGPLQVLAFSPSAGGGFASFARMGGGGFAGGDFVLPEGGPVAIEVRSGGLRLPVLPEPRTPYELRVVRTGCRGDWDGSGERNADDLYAYLEDYFDARGEFDGLGAVAGVGDLLGFVQAWLGPCQ